MKIRIAILDDNRFLLQALEEKVSLFNDLEHRISLVSGEVLLQKLQENLNVDMILMDVAKHCKEFNTNSDLNLALSARH